MKTMKNQIPKSNAKIISEKEVRTTIDAEGLEETTTVEKTRTVERSSEPDYIKLYTRMWCEFNQIPPRHRPLFLQLVTRMSYCNTSSLGTSQIVYTSGPNGIAIREALGWKQKDSLMKGLKALKDCGAIRMVSRGVYQINPSYAGRGEWKYNPKFDRGGVEDLVATFDFASGEVETKIIWTDDGKPSPLNDIYREMLGTSPQQHDRATLKTTSRKPRKPAQEAQEASQEGQEAREDANPILDGQTALEAVVGPSTDPENKAS